MNKNSEIKRRIRELVGGGEMLPISCEIVSVEGNSCTVKLHDGLAIDDVRLRATLAGGADELLVVPKVGSKALAISVTGTLDDLALIKCDKIEKIIYKQSGLELEIDSSAKKLKIKGFGLEIDGQAKKMDVKNNAVSLKELFGSIHDIIQTLQVTTPNGPSAGATLDSVGKLATLKTKIGQLLT